MSASSSARVAVEVRVLAGEAAERIVTKMGIAAPTIRAYEAIFFDVRGCLDQVGYVYQVIEDGAETDGEYGRACKRLAYRGGPLVADALLEDPAAIQKPAEAGQVGAFFAGCRRAALKRNLALAAEALRALDPRMAAGAIRLEGENRATDAEAGSTEAQLGEELQRLLNNIKFTRANPHEVDPSWIYGCVELRAGDQQLLAMGIEPPGLAELKDAKFPGPDEQQAPDPRR